MVPGTFFSSFSGLTSVAYRQPFPLMDIRFIPVQDAASRLPVNLHVDWTMHHAAVLDACRSDYFENCVERLITHSKTIMLNRIG